AESEYSGIDGGSIGALVKVHSTAYRRRPDGHERKRPPQRAAACMMRYGTFDQAVAVISSLSRTYWSNSVKPPICCWPTKICGTVVTGLPMVFSISALV